MMTRFNEFHPFYESIGIFVSLNFFRIPRRNEAELFGCEGPYQGLSEQPRA
jgi:hypothetical protein